MRRSSIAALAAAAAALAVAAVAGAGGAGPFVHETSASVFQQTASTNGPVQTSSRQFKPLNGASPTLTTDPVSTDWNALTVTVMVVLKSGKGALRVVDAAGVATGPMYPSSVPVAGKGPHTVEFVLGPADEYIARPEIQWKRKGRGALKAASVVAAFEGNPD